MSHVYIDTFVPAPTTTPRGAVAIGLIATFVQDILAWNKVRVDRARMLRDVIKLRDYANSLRYSAPSLAADLLAAADRAT